MPTYFIKFNDAIGDWFFMREGWWSDSYRDAYRFTDKETADKYATEAEARLNEGLHDHHPNFPRPERARAKCRVVSMRAGS